MKPGKAILRRMPMTAIPTLNKSYTRPSSVAAQEEVDTRPTPEVERIQVVVDGEWVPLTDNIIDVSTVNPIQIAFTTPMAGFSDYLLTHASIVAPTSVTWWDDWHIGIIIEEPLAANTDYVLELSRFESKLGKWMVPVILHFTTTRVIS